MAEIEYWATLAEVNTVEKSTRWLVLLPSPVLSYSAKRTSALIVREIWPRRKWIQLLDLRVWFGGAPLLPSYKSQVSVYGIKRTGLLLTGGIDDIWQRAIFEDGLSVLGPRPTQVNLVREAAFGIISCFYGTRVNNVCMRDTRLI